MEETYLKSCYAELDSIKIHYLDTLTPGKVIICIHGLWGRATTWTSFMKLYSKKYRVIAVDLRGHGLSGKPMVPYTADIMSEDIAKLMKHLNINKAIILGHSIGGRIAAYLAYNHPELVEKLAILDKSATGIDPNTNVDHSKIFEDPFTGKWPLPFKDLETARTYLLNHTEDALEFFYFMLSLKEVENGYDFMFSQRAVGCIIANNFSWFHILPGIMCPVLLVKTSSNEAFSDGVWEKMQSLITDCTAREMSHPNHNVHLANKEEFYQYISDFIK